MSTLKNNLTRLGVPSQSWYNECVHRLLWAVRKPAEFLPRPKPVLSINQIDVMFRVNAGLPSPPQYTATFTLLGLFAFLRILNLVPTARDKFDPERHLCTGDVAVSSVEPLLI